MQKMSWSEQQRLQKQQRKQQQEYQHREQQREQQKVQQRVQQQQREWEEAFQLTQPYLAATQAPPTTEDQNCFVYFDGSRAWFSPGKMHVDMHRDGDRPAFIAANGDQAYMQHGKLHRNGDEPAFVGADGSLGWYQNGELHRDHGPAFISADGMKQYAQHGRAMLPPQYGGGK